MESMQASQFQSGRYNLNTNYRVEHYVDVELKDIERHYHEFYEVIFFYSGDVEYYIDSQSFYPVANDVLFINIAQVHMPRMHTAFPPYDRISLFLDKNYLAKLSDGSVDFESLFLSHKINLAHLNMEDSWTVKALLSKLSNLSVSENTLGNSLLARSYITEILVFLARASSLSAPDRAPVEAEANSRIVLIKKYIAKNLAGNLSLNSIASEMHLSKYYLSHEFTKHTGMSLYSYIIKMRLAKAKEMLQNQVSIGEVVFECGFSDVSSFSRSFKKEFSMTPSQFLSSFRQSE